MLGIAMIFWSVIIWPFIIKSRIHVDQGNFPSGIAVVRTIGISLKVNWKITHTEQGIAVHISYMNAKHKRERGMKEMQQMQSKLIPIVISAPYLRRQLLSYLSILHIETNARIGLDNAAHTAIICGAASALLGCLPHAKGMITPDFRNTTFTADIKCIASFHLGKLLISAVLFLCATVALKVRQGVGGIFYGSTKFHQRRDANST